MKINSIPTIQLSEALRQGRVYVVRLDPPDQAGNLGPDGGLLWPEVLLCGNQADADALAQFLSQAALRDLAEFMAAENPDMAWRQSDADHYVVDRCENVSSYRWAHLISPSREAVRSLEALRGRVHE